MANHLPAVSTPVSARQPSADTTRAAAVAGLAGELRQTFGCDFSLLDGATGGVIATSDAHQDIDWELRADICRAVSRHGQPEVIEDDDPLLVIAIPLSASDGQPIVAVGTFVSRVLAGATACCSSGLLGLQGTPLAAWLERQPVWQASALLATSRLLANKQAIERRAEHLEQEVGNLSLHLATTYEEISLIYRLTQNLKLSSKDDELGRLALEWLADVLPAESLAMHLLPGSEPNGMTHETLREPRLLTHGPCPVDAEQFVALVAQLGMTSNHRPLVLNPPTTSAGDWKFPGVRQLIVVPLCESTNIFGWLAVFNHVSGEEFGTVEASLLTSVSAILGIHGGNRELYRQQAELFGSVVRALTSAIDAKDPYTCGHSDRVARVAVRLAQEFDCDAENLNTIYLSGLLHDIGKIGIDDNVLRKPGRLTEAEYEHIKTHAEIGYKILYGLKQMGDVLPVVLHHHEQWDGHGYPHQLAGEAVPLMARIVAVADAFDAMCSDRPYRKGMADDKLDSILRGGAGTQWDPQVVRAFFAAREDIRQISVSSRERQSVGLDVREWA